MTTPSFVNEFDEVVLAVSHETKTVLYWSKLPLAEKYLLQEYIDLKHKLDLNTFASTRAPNGAIYAELFPIKFVKNEVSKVATVVEAKVAEAKVEAVVETKIEEVKAEIKPVATKAKEKVVEVAKEAATAVEKLAEEVKTAL